MNVKNKSQYQAKLREFNKLNLSNSISDHKSADGAIGACKMAMVLLEINFVIIIIDVILWTCCKYSDNDSFVRDVMNVSNFLNMVAFLLTAIAASLLIKAVSSISADVLSVDGKCTDILSRINAVDDKLDHCSIENVCEER